MNHRDWFRWMPCNHQLRHWRPVEGTAAGAIEFARDPERCGVCEICEAITGERRACAAAVRSLLGGDFCGSGVGALTAAIGEIESRPDPPPGSSTSCPPPPEVSDSPDPFVNVVTEL